MTVEVDDREQQSVRSDLVAADEEVRRLAVERVSLLPIEEAVACLVERIGDESWRVRKSAVERLEACPDTAAVVRALILALGDGENTGRRNSAVEALVGCGAKAVPKLVESLSSDDPDVRKLIVDSLAGIGDERAVPDLIDASDDPDTNVRAAIADAIGALGGPAASQALHAIAVRPNEEQLVRFSAMHAMAALEVPVLARELAPVLSDPVLRSAGLALLGRTEDDEAFAILTKALGENSHSVREAAIASLVRMLSRVDGVDADRMVAAIREEARVQPGAIESAIERLDQASLPIRLMLVQFLGVIGTDEVVIPILAAANDEALAQIALEGLAAIGERAEGVIDEAWSELDGSARRNACRLFGRMRGARSAARVVSALSSPLHEIRIAAAEAVGLRGLCDALPLLINRLETASVEDDFESEEELAVLTDCLIALARPTATDPSEERAEQVVFLLTASLDGASAPVRLAIARVIGRVGRHRDAQVIEFLLKDPSAQVRRAAVDALARLDPGTAAESLRLALADEASKVRIAAANALGASRSDEVTDVLRCLADDEEPDVRAAAIRALGVRLSGALDQEHRALVMELLDHALDDHAVVALAAIDRYRETGDGAVEPVLRSLGRPEPEVVLEAVRCIATASNPAHLEALLPLVSHPDWTVRAEAISALAERSVARAVPAMLRRLETEQDEFVRGAMLRALDRLGG